MNEPTASNVLNGSLCTATGRRKSVQFKKNPTVREFLANSGQANPARGERVERAGTRKLQKRDERLDSTGDATPSWWVQKAQQRQHQQRQSRYKDSRIFSPSSDESSETIILPARFDKHGRRKPEASGDPLVDVLQDIK